MDRELVFLGEERNLYYGEDEEERKAGVGVWIAFFPRCYGLVDLQRGF